MRFVDLALSPIAVDHGSAMRRDAPRDPFARSADYEDRADFSTLFYDCHWTADDSAITCIGPRLGSLAAFLERCQFRARPSGALLTPQIGEIGTLAHLRLPTPPATRSLWLDSPAGTRIIVPQPNEQALFKDRRVLLTMSLNNPLHWIRDWAWFYVRTHGTNTILFYDNGSQFYSKQDIRDALATVPGLDLLAIPDWPYRFGAPNGPLGTNDSRFSQRGMLEHARHRFLQQAASVIHVDIDELALPLAGAGLHEAAEAARTGYVRFGGQWIERLTEDGALPPLDQITHETWRYRLKSRRAASPKWAVSPRKHAPKVFWTVHRVYGRKPDAEASRGFSHRHLFGMKTPDTDARNIKRLDNTPTMAPDPALHEPDPELAKALGRLRADPAFANRPPVAPFARPGDPLAARVLAGEAYRAGRPVRALELLDLAIDLAPDTPGFHEFRAEILAAQGAQKDAEAALAKAHDIRLSNPENAAVMVRAAREERDFDGALRIAEQALAINPGSGILHLALSDALASLERHAASADAADRAADLGLDSIRLHWRRGLANIRAGRPETAAMAYAAMREQGIDTQVDWLRYWRGVMRVARMTLTGPELDSALADLGRQALDILCQYDETTPAVQAEFAELAGPA